MTDENVLFIINLLIYLLIFIFPVIFYLKFIDKVSPLEFLKLTKNIKQNFIKGFVISILFILVLILKKLIVGFNNINFNIGILWISGLTVGILEEIPFRGFILQKLTKHTDFIAANLLTTLLFITIHIPNWLLNGVNIIDSTKSLVVVSFILGYLFKETDSLWVPIICHSVFNIIIWIGLG
ncbi:CPBP family intramembrane glutamic endopeptidase [Clostridium homopropionicum]|nr:CPBP family intramembrane glutamic endopeptidase [Clostridium homopropionicum]